MAVTIAMNLGSGDNVNTVDTRPSHHAANVCKNPAVISYTGRSIGEEKILLRIARR